MTLKEAMDSLEAFGTQKMRDQNIRHGASGPQFGVKMGDIRALAKAIKMDHDLGRLLWATENLDARFLAILILKPKQLEESELELMVASVNFGALADWLNSYIVKNHPAKEVLRMKWLDEESPYLQRAAWSLTTERVSKKADGLNLSALLNTIESQLLSKPEAAQWTMNYCLAEIGIRYPEHRERAISIGESLGLYRDYPVSKGCTSPFAPIWIKEIVSRQ